ncbi:MAG: amidohydrolase [Clostridiales bacterium]|nr:amidohydrolase [Clostridiales bacterium]
MTKLIRGGLIFDAVRPEPFKGDILIKDGKIQAIGGKVKAPKGAEIIDAEGLNVYPGLVECHGHIGLDGWAMGYEGADYNEYTDPVTPHLRAIDGLNPFDYSLKDAALGGVTTLCTGPGSSNVIGGTFAAFKPVGKCIDDMVIKAEAAMKCAFGENPKRCYRDKSITSRMSTAAKLREMLFKAQEYDKKIKAAGDDESKLPAFDMRLNALLPVIRGEMPLKAHAHQANDILTALRIAREFGVKLTLEHVTDGALIVDELVKADVPLAIGPTDGQPSKIELKNKSWETPGILAKAGCRVSIITDSPVTIQSHLRLCAALAIKSGMDRFDAFKAITINPANHIGVADRVGSLEKGKDADIVLTDGCIFEIQTRILATYINGEKVEKD